MYSAAGQGLLAAHQADLVHRDFKPDNVLLGKDGLPRVADFGLARIEASQPNSPYASLPIPVARRMLSKPSLSNLTQAGAVIGTPLYMSPEQHMGQPVDSRTDQFSFCVALYEALYGKMPFAGDTLQKLYFNVITGKVQPRPADSHVPTIIHEAILRGLSVKPEQRFPSMSELLVALSIDIARDASIGPGARREVIVSMIAVNLIVALSVQVPEWLGMGPRHASLTTAAALFAVFTVMALRFRRVTSKNWFHRGMIVYGFVVAAWLLALRGVGFAIGLSIQQIMTLDLLAITAMTGMTVGTIQPRLWPLVPIAALSAIASVLEPRAVKYLMPAVLMLGYVSSAALWYQAAIAPRRKHLPRTPV